MTFDISKVILAIIIGQSGESSLIVFKINLFYIKIIKALKVVPGPEFFHENV
jgi:hypothetical protein